MKNSTGWVIASVLASISAHTTSGILEGVWLVVGVLFAAQAIRCARMGN